MADVRQYPPQPIDPAINTAGREGLTGTAPASLYAPSLDREQITIQQRKGFDRFGPLQPAHNGVRVGMDLRPDDEQAP